MNLADINLNLIHLVLPPEKFLNLNLKMMKSFELLQFGILMPVLSKISLKTVDSTNTFLLDSNLPEGSSVYTKNQVSGHGRRNR